LRHAGFQPFIHAGKILFNGSKQCQLLPLPAVQAGKLLFQPFLFLQPLYVIITAAGQQGKSSADIVQGNIFAAIRFEGSLRFGQGPVEIVPQGLTFELKALLFAHHRLTPDLRCLPRFVMLVQSVSGRIEVCFRLRLLLFFYFGLTDDIAAVFKRRSTRIQLDYNNLIPHRTVGGNCEFSETGGTKGLVETLSLPTLPLLPFGLLKLFGCTNKLQPDA